MKWFTLAILLLAVFKTKAQLPVLYNADSKIVDSLVNCIRMHPNGDSQYILTLHRISRPPEQKAPLQSDLEKINRIEIGKK